MENHKSPWTKKEEDNYHRLRLEEPISTISKNINELNRIE